MLSRFLTLFHHRSHPPGNPPSPRTATIIKFWHICHDLRSLSGAHPRGGPGGPSPPWDMKNIIFSGFRPLNYVIYIFEVCFLCFLLCGRTEEACSMVNSLRKVDFSHPTGHYTYMKQKFGPHPWENPGCASGHCLQPQVVPLFKCHFVNLFPGNLHYIMNYKSKNGVKDHLTPKWNIVVFLKIHCAHFEFSFWSFGGSQVRPASRRSFWRHVSVFSPNLWWKYLILWTPIIVLVCLNTRFYVNVGCFRYLWIWLVYSRRKWFWTFHIKLMGVAREFFSLEISHCIFVPLPVGWM